MRCRVEKRMTGRELSDSILSTEYVMFEEFQKMWREINKKVSSLGYDSLGNEAEISFIVEWKDTIYDNIPSKYCGR